jgi:hypothetical protein
MLTGDLANGVVTRSASRNPISSANPGAIKARALKQPASRPGDRNPAFGSRKIGALRDLPFVFSSLTTPYDR